ncbi:MAG: hypothetical protein AAF823_14085 [Planctomycetota bacterium]
MSRASASQFEIDKPTLVCGVTGRELVAGEAYVATLMELSEAELGAMSPAERKRHAMGLKRVDVSAEAWDAGRRPGGGERAVYCWWRTRVPEAGQSKRKMLVDDAALMVLLERLGEAESDERLAFRFVLALILLRKKLLRHDGVDRREDGAWWVFTPKADVSKGPLGRWSDKRVIEVRDAELDEPTVDAVTEQLGEVLEGSVG